MSAAEPLDPGSPHADAPTPADQPGFVDPEVGAHTGADVRPDAFEELAAAASTEVTGAPTAQLAANPLTGEVHPRSPAPYRGVNDLPPAPRRKLTDSVTLPSRAESSSWAPPSSNDRAVGILDAAIVDGVVDEDMLARGVDVALDERDWSGLATAAAAVTDPYVAAALAYMAAVTAWRVGADAQVGSLAQLACLPGVGVHPLVVDRSTRLRPARSLSLDPSTERTVRLPVSDRTAQVLACWPADADNLPDPQTLSYPLACVAVAVGACAGVDLRHLYLPEQP